MANQPFEVFAHLAFGTLLSFAFSVPAPAGLTRSWRWDAARGVATGIVDRD